MTEGDLLGAMQSAGKELDDEELKGAMKDCGLGTPATRANIIETLLKRVSSNARVTSCSLRLKGSNWSNPSGPRP